MESLPCFANDPSTDCFGNADGSVNSLISLAVVIVLAWSLMRAASIVIALTF